MPARSMQYFAAMHDMVGTGDMKEISRLRASFMRDNCEDIVVCPKPQRVGLFVHNIPDLVKPVRRHLNIPTDGSEPEPAGEILDIFMSRNSFNDSTGMGCSPPYFCGSPPTRADNPVVHDVQFIHQRGQVSQSPLSKSKNYNRSSYGPNAAVTIEGFDCSGRDTRCSIPALA